MFAITQTLGLFFTGIVYMCCNLLLCHKVKNATDPLGRAAPARGCPRGSCQRVHPQRLASNINILNKTTGSLSMLHLKGCINSKRTTRKAPCISLRKIKSKETFFILRKHKELVQETGQPDKAARVSSESWKSAAMQRATCVPAACASDGYR